MPEKHIPYGRQSITDDDIAAVSEVLKSDYLTQGPVIPQFEEAFADYIGSKYAVAVANGTAALHLSYLAMGIKAGQKVLTTPITFSASANGAAYTGAEVTFADINPDTFLLDLNQVEEILKKDNKISCVTPVDMCGLTSDLVELRDLAAKYDAQVLEDACHAPGASYESTNGVIKAGDCQFTDAAIFSFHPVKHIAAGEGGMVTTNDPALYDKLQRLRTHGITKDPKLLKENHGPWYYDMVDLGFNYRLTDIQAALGISQLRKIDQNLTQRRRIAAKYRDELSDLPIGFQSIPEGHEHAYHLFVITTTRREELYMHLRAANIYAQVHYVPVHLLSYYAKQGWKKGDFPQAEDYYSKCLSLPIYPTLRDEDHDFVIEEIRNFF